jgi:hypothetical protein
MAGYGKMPEKKAKGIIKKADVPEFEKKLASAKGVLEANRKKNDIPTMMEKRYGK